MLKPLSILSLTLQSDSSDIVTSMKNTLKAVKTLKSLAEEDPKQWPTIQLIQSRIREVDGQKEYQGVQLENFDSCLDKCNPQATADLQRIQEKLKTRLEWNDLNILRAILAFLDTQSWLKRNDPNSENTECDVGMIEIRAALDLIVSTFRAPLEPKGVSLETIQDELEEAVDYARTYLPIGTESYRRVWYKLHTCPDSSKWPNLLFVCQLTFSLPFSTNRVEQTFSMLKIVKTKRRTSLHTSTLSDLLEINVNGPPLSLCNPDAAVDLWWRECSTTRRVNQNPRKAYQPRASSSSNQTEEESDKEESTLVLDDWDDWVCTH